MIVSAEAFMKSMGKGPAPRVVLFCPGKPPWGKEDFEPYLVDQAVSRVVEAYVDPSLRDLTYTVVYADETTPGAVAEEANTLPFLAERRVIVVRNAQRHLAMPAEKRSPLAPLLSYLESPSESTVLLLIAHEVDRRKRIFKLCESNGLVVECPQLNDVEMGKWIKKQVKQKHCSVNDAAIEALLERVGSRLSDMANALDLVCNYVATGGEITEAAVMAACGNVAETTVWDLTDAIATSRSDAALNALHELQACNRSPDEILGTINWLLESAYKALPETEPRNAKQIVQEKTAPLAQKFGKQRIIDALALCTKTQFAMRTTGADKDLLLELLVIKFSEANKSGQRTRARR